MIIAGSACLTITRAGKAAVQGLPRLTVTMRVHIAAIIAISTVLHAAVSAQDRSPRASLRDITGETLPPDPWTWKRWYERRK